MRMKYYNHIEHKQKSAKVNADVKNYVVEQRKKRARNLSKEKYYGIVSLNALEEKKVYIVSDFDLDDEVIKRDKYRKYLNSIEYKTFRKNLRQEISKRLDRMPDRVRQAMFLRFFREYSINNIAKALEISKGAAQEYLRRGTCFIKKFLEKDIREQDELDRKREEERIKRELEELNTNQSKKTGVR